MPTTPRLKRRMICLHCLEAFTPDQQKWIDANGEEGPPPPVDTSLLRRWRTSHRFLKRYADWADSGYVPSCPGGHALPVGMDNRPTMCIALIGETASSKSSYFTALIDSLSRGALADYDLAFDLPGDNATRFHQQYYMPLIQDKVQLPATQPRLGVPHEPFQLIARSSSPDSRREAVNIVFFDPSGEEMSEQELARYHKFLYVADVVMLFLPVTALPALRSALARQDEDSKARSILRSTNIFNRTADQVHRRGGFNIDRDLDEVVAMVLVTQGDLLAGLQGFDGDLLEESEFNATSASVVRARIESDSHRVADFIAAHDGADLVANVALRFPEVSFHVTAAVGHDPVDGVYPAYSPIRCVDPFFNVLVKVGVIKVD